MRTQKALSASQLAPSAAALSKHDVLVGRRNGVCGVATLAHGSTIGCAPRLASVRCATQRISRAKSDRLLAEFTLMAAQRAADFIECLAQARPKWMFFAAGKMRAVRRA